jgi:hypothetical protein
MNWAGGFSPTSGNERLVLLALADACSRDDGTGCWPSAATIARKANISDRTVRRVIARLEADGQVVVHRGGGRAGSTNSYTVITGIHNPGHSRVRGPRTQLCHPIHHRTTGEPPPAPGRARTSGPGRPHWLPGSGSSLTGSPAAARCGG